ncbi:ArnT family glycosyltransferase [Streptomyces iranensis]|uniref:4-amino-4-deoxy-L-arabinose transferase-like glycosyltransferase n=1 Tax=Streptomyces iranensis TaxID=576784 RepID=A0A060ZQW4_9ACTN|nr:glycosyltransferase family 39 protein [Streptomyces iranensis]MBP2066764.1 4-amino-4-deoxy-L-arabinose transferase-like glycosyltransferase [Streptomyces iranensis]CDR08587.1 glycosyl transferase family 39 [Streptomyces iranensis]
MTTYDYGTREAGPPPTPAAAPRPGPRVPGGSRLARAWRGRPEDPRWARPALWALLAATTVLYLWSLGASGYANQFYSAAVQAGGESWKAFFFGSSDAANSITVDKPPAALWPMALSVRLFGLSSWAVLAPEALMGVATVGVLYAAVRRRFGAAAGLIAGAALAVTPVAALMFRFNNPDALLCLLMVSAVYCVLRALEDARTKWLVLAGVCFGLGFLTKTLQAWLILPPLAVVYAVCAPAKFGRRIGQLLLAGLAMVVSGGWWVAIVELWPESSRPYIGGSQHNSFLELTFGYNGLGRINGDETGSVGGGGPGGPGGRGGGRWGDTGIDRLFGSDMGGQIAWLLPAAFILLAAGIWLTWRAKRTDTRRAAFLVWGGALLMTFATFSFMSGIFHQYYNIALAPYIAALVGMGAALLWERWSEGGRAGAAASAVLAVTVAVTAYLSYVLLGRSPDWYPWLRWAVLIGGLAAAAGLLLTARLGRRAALAAAGLGLAAGLAGPVAYTLNTVDTPKHGSIVTAGPSVAGGMGGPGGGFPGGGRGGPPGMQNGRQGAGQQGQGSQGGQGQQGQGQQGQGQGGPQGMPGGGTGGGTGGGQPGGGQNGFPGGGFPGGGQSPRNGTGNSQGGQGQNGRPGMLPGGGMGEGGRRGGGMGGLLDGQQVDADVEAKLEKNADDYTWAAAAIGSQNAASYQLATEKPVMAIGGFNGSDPSPTLAQFKEYVKQGRIHYFISSGTGMGGGPGGGQGTSSQITSWIEATYKKVTVGGSTLYDLTQKA